MTAGVAARPRRPTRTLVVLAAAALAFSIGQTVVIPVLPAMQREYEVDASDATWTVTVLLITAFLSTPLVGRLGDIRASIAGS